MAKEQQRFIDLLPKAEYLEHHLNGLGWRKVICCEECIHNYGNKNGCEYNPEDIVCTYWMSDGLTEKDFCSQAERKEE